MRRRTVPISMLVAVGSLGLPAAAPAIDFCSPSERSCARLAVPLDHRGKVPGTVRLQVERSRARRAIRPPLFLFAGGPGQSATRGFDLRVVQDLLGSEARARDVIVMDQRGTGDSDVLRCRRLERANILSARDAAAECARSLGPRRAFYTTRDTVADIEAVRRELGAQKIALMGTSYGTKVVLAYARTYPARVDRIVLDSVVALDGPSPLELESLASAPSVARARCRPGCARVTRDAGGDLSRLARRVDRRPLRGFVVDGRGRKRRMTMSGFDLSLLLLVGDLDDTVRLALSAATRSALRGDMAPILRLLDGARRVEGELGDPRDLSAAAYAATACEELALPWARTTPFAARRTQARALVSRLPASAFGPFGPSTALQTDFLDLCERWPAAPAAPLIGGGSLPDVPALLLNGDADARTPLASARRVATAFPRGRVLVGRGSGHDVLGQDSTGCFIRATRRFLAGVLALRPCPRARREPVLRRLPATVRDVPRKRGVPGRAGRMVSVVERTLDFTAREAVTGFIASFEDIFSGRAPRSFAVGGLRGGIITVGGKDGERLVLKRVALVRGVSVSGVLRSPYERRMRGALRITGRAAARGTLQVSRGRVTGRLGGRSVSARLKVISVSELVEELFARSTALDHHRPPIR